MNISDILTDVVLLEKAESKRELLQILSQKLAAVSGVDERALFDVVWERESLGSTGFGNGTAMPHGRIPELNRLYGIFAKLAQPLEFDAADNKPVDLVFMLLSPENSGADHLTALAKISCLLKDEENPRRLREASDVQCIRDILTK